MADLASQLGATDALLAQLDTVPLADLTPGDGITIVYQSIHAQDDSLQAVTARVIGRDGDTVYALEPISDYDGHGMRGFELAPDAPLYRYTHSHKIDYERAPDGGHKPTSPHRSQLGPVETFIDAGDVTAINRRSIPWGPFRLPHGRVGRRGSDTRTPALCHRLFDAEGSAPCDYDFAIPGHDRRGIDADGDIVNVHEFETRAAWLFDDAQIHADLEMMRRAH